MQYALLICSDDDCTEAFEAWGTLDELEALACDCGCALHVLTISEDDEDPARELELMPLAA
jgi:hypothetical protein